MKNFIVGDIHSSYDKLMNVLEKASFSDGDILYSVGDLCDRGNKPIETLDFLYSLGDRFKPVFGNHDIWLYELLSTNYTSRCWSYNGGKFTFIPIENTINREDRLKLKEWMSSFPYRLWYKNICIQHNLIPMEYLENVEIDLENVTLSNCFDCGLIGDKDYDEYTWNRTIAEDVEKPNTYDSSLYDGYDKDSIYIMGHTPEPNGLIVKTDKPRIINIDSCAFSTKKFYGVNGHLTLMDLDTFDYWTSNKKGRNRLESKVLEKLKIM